MEAIIGFRGKQFSKNDFIISSGQLIFWLEETIFQRLLPVIFFFLLVETMFQKNPSLRLVETNFRADNGFRKKKEKLQVKEYCFHEIKILIRPAGMKDSLKKYVFTMPKNYFYQQKYSILSN